MPGPTTPKARSTRARRPLEQAHDRHLTSPDRGLLWLARAAAWTCAAFGLSVGAHVVGGGSLPSTGVAAFLVVALLWSGLLLTRRRLGPLPLITTLGVTQVVLHSGLTLTERAVACSSTTTATGPHAGHDLALTCESSASGAAAALTHADHSTPVMTIAHVLAAIVLGLVLAKGEDAVWFVARLLVPVLPSAPALPSIGRLPLTPSHAGERARRVLLLGGVGRRGPPARRAPAVT